MLDALLKQFKSLNLDEMRKPGFTQKEKRQIEECVENVNRGSGWRRIEACPCCQSNDRRILFARFGKNVVQCNQCSLGYAEEFPVDFSDVVSDQSYLPVQQSNYLENSTYRRECFGKERLEIIRQHAPHAKTLLDIGCVVLRTRKVSRLSSPRSRTGS